MCQSVFWSVNVLGAGHRWVGGELVMSPHTCPPPSIWANLLQMVIRAITDIMTITMGGGWLNLGISLSYWGTRVWDLPSPRSPFGTSNQNITRIANAVQCHSQLSGHYDCHDLRFSIVGNINKFTTVHKNLSTLVKTRPSNQCLTQILMVETPGNIKNNYTYQAGEQHGSDVSDRMWDESRIWPWMGLGLDLGSGLGLGVIPGLRSGIGSGLKLDLSHTATTSKWRKFKPMYIFKTHFSTDIVTNKQPWEDSATQLLSSR